MLLYGGYVLPIFVIPFKVRENNIRNPSGEVVKRFVEVVPPYRGSSAKDAPFRRRENPIRIFGG